MEAKIALFDADHNPMGETYARRARQFVKQQRAVWLDEEHTAIRFVTDEDEAWDAEAPASPTTARPDPAAPATGKSGSRLYALAAKRLRDRNLLILHTLALLPGYYFIFILMDDILFTRDTFMIGFGLGIGFTLWTLSYIKRVRRVWKQYAMPRLHGWEARRAHNLDIEVEKLKRMGYTE